MLTLNQILRKLKQLQEAHDQLNSFRFGVMPEAQSETPIIYPLMGVDLLPGTLNPKQNQTRLLLYFGAKTWQDRFDEQEVLSDMQLVALDIYAQFKEYLEANSVELLGNAPFSSFIGNWNDHVTGYQMEITINQFYAADTCYTSYTPAYASILDKATGGLLIKLYPGDSYTVEQLTEIIDTITANETTIIDPID